jgi:hypothetical protein
VLGHFSSKVYAAGINSQHAEPHPGMLKLMCWSWALCTAVQQPKLVEGWRCSSLAQSMYLQRAAPLGVVFEEHERQLLLPRRWIKEHNISWIKLGCRFCNRAYGQECSTLMKPCL